MPIRYTIVALSLVFGLSWFVLGTQLTVYEDGSYQLTGCNPTQLCR